VIFTEHHWPGNIRELENILERSMNVIEGNVIQVQSIPVYMRRRGPIPVVEDTGVDHSLQAEVELAEQRAIMKALKLASISIWKQTGRSEAFEYTSGKSLSEN
jgi:transcriptional regulator with PAS, ATPase and Fis domain